MAGKEKTFRRASKILERHRKRLLKIRGVRGVAVGSAADYGGREGACLLVYVEKGVDRASLPTGIDGIPVHVIP